ncbi:MAG TPA: zinc-binding dehydrogenase, partial [Acidimicrobiia bacterium]
VAAGASVVALDLRPERRDVAANLGAIVTADTPPEYVLGSTDVVLEISGTESGMRTALACLGPGGRLVAVGFQKSPFLLDVIDLTLAEQQLIGTNGVDPATDLPEAVRLLSAAPADTWHAIAPTVIRLEDVAAALAGIASGDSGPIKTLVSPVS